MIDLNHILEYEWRVFIDHVSHFYRIPISLLNEYTADFNWRKISRNKWIDWDRATIERYKDKLDWESFTHDSEFHWEVMDFKRFKGYLSKNWIGFNKNFKITEDFLAKPPKKNFRIFDNNIYLTEDLKRKFPDRIFKHTSRKEEELSKSEVLENFRKHGERSSISLYKHFIKNELNDEILESTLKQKHNKSQKYYFLSHKISFIANYDLQEKINREIPFNKNAYKKEIERVFSKPNKIAKVKAAFLDGPKIIPEIKRIENSGSLFLVSEHFKKLLDQFGMYTYYDVDVKHKNLTADSKFYAVSFLDSELEETIDYSKAEVKAYKSEAYNKNSPFEPYKINVSSQKEYYQHFSSAYKQKLYLQIHSHPVIKAIDIFYYKYETFVVSEYFKEAVEKVFPDQFKFITAHELNISMPEKEYQLRKKKYQDFDWVSLGIGKTTTRPDKELMFYKRKRNRLKKNPATVPAEAFSADEYRKIEMKLNISIPKKVKERLKKSFPEDYEMLQIDEFYIQNEYADNEPKTYNALIVGTNGVGDEIGFILDKESDYIYDARLVEFLHEEGSAEFV